MKPKFTLALTQVLLNFYPFTFEAFGIISLRETGIRKMCTKEKANMCYRQCKAAYTREADSDLPLKGTMYSKPV